MSLWEGPLVREVLEVVGRGDYKEEERVWVGGRVRGVLEVLSRGDPTEEEERVCSLISPLL